MNTITVCMGSSCFSKGNSANAEFINRFIAEHNLQDKIEVIGCLCLCSNACSRGPYIKINDKLIPFVSEQTLPDIIVKELELKL
jgi:NADH:ubiquinone oxidoreductase subunit E